MLKVFQATDKTYSSNGDLIVNPLKAQVHKEDNGEFYLDLETPFNEKGKNIAKEEGTYTTITGSATIQNVSASKLQEVLQLDGDTTQETTTGKNLFKPTLQSNGTNISMTRCSVSVSGDEFTFVASGTDMYFGNVIATGSNYSNALGYLMEIPSGATTIYIKSTNNVFNKNFITFYDSSKVSLGFSQITDSKAIPSGAKYFNVRIGYGDSVSGTTYKTKIMLSTTGGDYEPYTNGASPNPTYPQPINVVSGRQEVDIVGKNWFNYATTETYTTSVNGSYLLQKGIDTNYIDVSQQNNGYYVNNYVNTGYRWFSMKVNLSKNTNFKFLCGDTNITVLTNIRLYGFNTLANGTTGTQISALKNGTTFNTGDYEYYLLAIYPHQQGTYIKDIQIVKSDVEDTTYEAYKGQSYEINLGKNLFNKANITSITNGTIENDVITSNAISSNYGGVSSTISGLTLEAGTYYISLKVKRDSGTSGNKLTRITLVGIDTSQITMVDNPNITNEYQIYSCRISPTSPITLTNIGIQLQPTNVNAVMSYTDIMISKDNNTTYAPYKTPIELCKIGTYQDFIKKGTGKNLFDKDNITSGKRLGQNGQLVDDTNYFTSDFIPVKEETWYTKNSPTIDAYHRICYYSSNNESSYISRVDDNSFPTPANTKYVRFCGALTELDTTMFNEGNIALPYEPYGMYNKWYIEKQIGKVVLDGSETWNKSNDNRYYLSQYGRYFKYNGSTDEYVLMSDIAIKPTNSSSTSEYKIYNNWNGNIFINHLNIASEYTTSQWATATAGHYIYGVLATPTYTEITDEELLTQINSIKLIEGLNNVSITSPYLTAPIYIHYNYIDEVSYSIKYNDYLIPNNIIVANTPQGEQAFRISNVEKTRRKIKIKANHVFYDSANLLIQDSYVVDKNCNDALDHLNNATSDTSPFTTISNINVIDSYRCVRKSLFQAIQVVIERWGGHLVRDNWTIGVYDTIGQDNGVTIRYAKNLKDITATYIWDDVVTKLLPVGKDGILLNELDPTASVYVESAVKYDIPYTKTISFEQNSIIEDDYKDENGTLILEDYKQALIDDLYAQAIEYITNNYLPKVNYTLSANVEKISDIGDTIEVIDEKLGINIMTNVISYDYDCILDKYIEIEFGNFTPELSNLMNSITENTERIVREENSTLAITLGRELEEATDKIWSALGNSYVIYDGDKILVVDSLPKETATNVIMINNGGIGFSNTGITGTFSSAWTIDNVLNMENINVINLTADLIKGGTLKLGSNLNQNGQIEVYDEANSLIAELNKNGLKMYGVDGSYVLMNNQVGFAGYDRNDNPIYWVNGDEFHMKKSVVEEEITLVNKMRIIPITIRDGNNQIVNDGIGFVNVAN